MTTINLGQVRPVYRGTWANSVTYKAYDWVAYDGSAYLALKDVPENYVPSSQTEYWVLFGAKGDRGEKGDQGIQGQPGVAGTTDYEELLHKPVSDTTLSVSGGFADAKTVGNRLGLIDTRVQNNETKLAKLMPAGSLINFAGAEIPEGYLLCNGAAISRTTYAKLFSVIGTLYGAGNGSTTFNLPNAHHLFLEATTTLSEVGQKVEAGLPNITFNSASDTNYPSGNSIIFSSSGALETGSISESGNFASYQAAQSITTRGYLRFNASRSSNKYGTSDTVQPEALRALLLIRY